MTESAESSVSQSNYEPAARFVLFVAAPVFCFADFVEAFAPLFFDAAFAGTVDRLVLCAFFPEAVFPAALALTPLPIAFRTSGGTFAFAAFTPVV